MPKKLPKYKQREILDELIDKADSLEYDEWEERYDQLDEEHQREYDDFAEQYATHAIGDEHWNSDA